MDNQDKNTYADMLIADMSVSRLSDIFEQDARRYSRELKEQEEARLK